MNSVQLPHNELSDLLDISLPVLKKHKISSSIFFVLILTYLSIPSFQIPFLNYSGFRLTALMEQRALENNLLYYPEQSWIDLDDVNHDLLKAIISIEDGKFFTHKGIDWKELDLSMKTNERRGETVRGASTITMQLSKNLYLSTEKSMFRKLKEILITLRMEKEVSKEKILEDYVNAVEWGEGIFGIDAAAEEFFGKLPSQLSTDECIRLAAVLPSPLLHLPNKNSSYVLRRSSIIRGRINDVILFPENKK